MAPVIMDGRVKVSFCTAIANINSPTTTELNAGTSLEGFITPDGLTITPTTGKVDVSNVGSTFTAARAGRRNYDLKLKLHHDGVSDVAWNLLPYRTSGFLAVRRGIDKATAYTTGQQLAIYPVETGEPDETDPTPDSTWDFEVDLFLTTDAQPRAVIA